jgi:hypothetical protein
MSAGHESVSIETARAYGPWLALISPLARILCCDAGPEAPPHHTDFNKEANPDVNATLTQTIDIVNGMSEQPALIIHVCANPLDRQSRYHGDLDQHG